MREFTSRRTAANAAAAAFQVLIVSGTLLISYRAAIVSSGADALGIYSLMLAVAGLAQAASLGSAIGTPRHVAALLGAKDLAALRGTLNTGLAVALLGPLIPALALLIGATLYADQMSSAEHQVVVRSLIPWMAAVAVIVPVSATTQAFVDGLNRTTSRAAVAVFAALAYLVTSLALIPHHGVAGLAAATVAQHVTATSACLVIARRSTAGILAPEWLSGEETRRQLRFNAGLQLLTLPTLAFDPVAKTLVAHSSGAAYVAVYEIASRLMVQTNNVLISANQALLPLLTFRGATSRISQRSFVVPFTGLGWMSVTAFGSVTVSLPFFSSLLLPDYPEAVAYAGCALSLAWLTNTLAGPGYFLAIALGRVRATIVANFMALGMIVVLGSLTLRLGFTVPVVLCVAFAANFAIVTRNAVRELQLSPADLVDAASLVQAAAVAAAAAVVMSLWLNGAPALVATGLGLVLILAASCFTIRRTPLLGAVTGALRARSVASA